MVKIKSCLILTCMLLAAGSITGCGKSTDVNQISQNTGSEQRESDSSSITRIQLSDTIQELDRGLSGIHFEGNDGFDEFLARGGADSDSDVAEYLTSNLKDSGISILFGKNPFGCSTLSVAGSDGGYLFGRNFDWNNCNALIVSASPENAYASVSTVNLDFVQAGGIDISKMPDGVQALVGMYAPLDGMNEKGLAVSVNMIQDSAAINQNTGKTGLTTTTAVRMLLNKAADVDEAVKLLDDYDMHGSMGMMIHFAIADASGKSVVVEYINNQMHVTDTPVVTNFYLTEGEKYGIGTSQSHERYEILADLISQNKQMSKEDVRDALDRVSKDNFDDYASTEWSIVMDQENKELTYYHREDYTKGYSIQIEQ